MEINEQEEKRQPAKGLSEMQGRATEQRSLAKSSLLSPSRAEQWWFREAWFRLRPFIVDFAVEAVLFGLFFAELGALPSAR